MLKPKRLCRYSLAILEPGDMRCEDSSCRIPYRHVPRAQTSLPRRPKVRPLLVRLRVALAVLVLLLLQLDRALVPRRRRRCRLRGAAAIAERRRYRRWHVRSRCRSRCG